MSDDNAHLHHNFHILQGGFRNFDGGGLRGGKLRDRRSPPPMFYKLEN